MSDRRERGRKTFEKVTGSAGAAMLEALGKASPEMRRFIEEFAFGDILSRPQLGLRERELAAIAALAALGTAERQLKVHINGALNVGCTAEEIVEVVLQTVIFAGFPAALNARGAAGEVFNERGIAAS